MAHLLLIDDEVSLLHSMKLQLSRAGHEIQCAETMAQATDILSQREPDLAIVDIRLPDGSGMDLVRKIRADGLAIPVVILTAFGSIPHAVSAMREGADDYIEKPVDLDQLAFIVERNLETQRLRGRVELYERTRPRTDSTPEMVGQSPRFLEAVSLARRIAAPGVEIASDLPTVLITGETGTGKDLLAHFIHASGPLAEHPLVHVDCASLPRELIESELFGHDRGAFTDAKATKRGLLEIATGGTVFLNEIGEMPIDSQAKLLTALERKSFRRVGGTRDLRMNARIVAATNTDLRERVEEKRFRDDLFYRLNVFAIELPPLRERGEDAQLLVDHFLTKLCRKYRRPEAYLTERARQTVRRYDWPGNIRELMHMTERACLLATEGLVDVEHLGIGTTGHRHASEAAYPECTLAEAEMHLIERALKRTGGNVTQAAKLLGLTRGALRRRLESASK